MAASVYLKEIEAIKPVLKRAARQAILPKFKKLKTSDFLEKGENKAQMLTTADLEASAILLAHCRKAYPASFSEEEITDLRFRAKTFWEIDPLDGTKEFVSKTDGFCVQAALIEKQNGVYLPVAGVIYHPLLDLFLYATRTEGPFLDNGRKTSVPTARVVYKEIIMDQRKVAPSPELGLFKAFLERKGMRASIVETGGTGDTVLRMFADEKSPNLYIYPRPHSSEWDLAPAEPIMKRAGGWISDLYGNEYAYNRRDTHNPGGYVISFLPKEKIIAWIKEFGVENLLKETDIAV
jgi:fructose-1,6-bisphosphatase/inositol monophosphatase family enzyme